MLEGAKERTPFVDQIVEMALAALLDREEFDDATTNRLRDLAHASRLSNTEAVVKALVGDEGD